MADYFYHIPENPAPERSTSGYFAAHDGKRLRYGLFPATARPLKGTVVILPGRNECIEKYFETARDLARRGFGSATFDWRGQGASDRLLGDAARGHVRSFFDYAKDLDRFFAEIVLPDCRGPFYLLAHSTGATVALLNAAAMVNRVRRMVLIAPLLAFSQTRLSMPVISRLTTALAWTGFGSRYVAGGPPRSEPFAGNVLTSDPVRYQRNAALSQAFPHLVVGGPTIAWVRAACRAASILQTPEFLAGMQIPTLIVAAGADQVVSNTAIEHFARQLRLSSLLTIDGARHELLQEADFYREQFFAAFDAFIPGTNAPVM